MTPHTICLSLSFICLLPWGCRSYTTLAGRMQGEHGWLFWVLTLSVVVCAQPTYLSDFKTPGADLKGIFYLRNVVDADAIVAAVGPAKEKGGKVGLFMLLLPGMVQLPSCCQQVQRASCCWQVADCGQLVVLCLLAAVPIAPRKLTGAVKPGTLAGEKGGN